MTSEQDQISVEALRGLSEAEFDRLRHIVRGLKRATTADTFVILSNNMEAIDGIHMTLARRSRSESSSSQHYLSYGHFGQRLLSTLSNYLSAGRMFTDSTCDVLSTQFGKASHSYTQFKTDLAMLFDDNPGYRFTYHLRNALQHVGTLPLAVRYSNADSPDERVQILASRDELLRGYRWHNMVRDDLLSGPEEVLLMPLIRSGYGGYLWLERRRAQRCLEALEGEVRALEEETRAIGDGPLLLMALAQEGGTPAVLRRMTQEVIPDRRYLQAAVHAFATGAFDPLLPIGYQAQAAVTPGGTVSGMLLGPGLDLLDEMYSAGQASADSAIVGAITAGPQSSADLISSLLNLNMVALAQIEMAVGLSIESQLSWLRQDVDPHEGGGPEKQGGRWVRVKC